MSYFKVIKFDAIDSTNNYLKKLYLKKIYSRQTANCRKLSIQR